MNSTAVSNTQYGGAHYNMIWWSLIAVCYAANLRDPLELKEAMTSPMTIKVWTPYQTTLTYTLDSEDLVSTLKQAVEKDIHWYPGNQIYTYHSMTLADDKTLGFYGIVDGDTLNLDDAPL